MNLLAVDTSYHGCSLALKVGEAVQKKHLSLHPDQLTTTLSTQLVPMIMFLCEHAGISLGQVTHIAATTGPASFTGLRITLATLQGIVLANKAKVYTTTRLHLMACQQLADLAYTEVEVTLDNQRGGVFHQVFHKDERESVPQAVSEVSVKMGEDPRITRLGEAFRRSQESEDDKEEALTLLHLAERLELHEFGGVEQLVPFYGHNPTFKKKFER